MHVPQYLAEGPVRVARFFVIPFCASSISSLVMGVNSTALDQAPRGTAPFFLVFPTDPNQLLYCLSFNVTGSYVFIQMSWVSWMPLRELTYSEVLRGVFYNLPLLPFRSGLSLAY